MLKEARGLEHDVLRQVDANLKLEAAKSALSMIACISAGRSSSEVEFLSVREKLTILKLEYDGRSSKDLRFREESERGEIEVPLPFRAHAAALSSRKPGETRVSNPTFYSQRSSGCPYNRS
jgi:hypothetical protein